MGHGHLAVEDAQQHLTDLTVYQKNVSFEVWR